MSCYDDHGHARINDYGQCSYCYFPVISALFNTKRLTTGYMSYPYAVLAIITYNTPHKTFHIEILALVPKPWGFEAVVPWSLA